MTGRHIAIFGLGRSGLGVAKAALALGSMPVIYDQASEGSVVKQDLVAEAKQIGIPVVFGWQGGFDPKPDLLVVNPAVPRKNPALLEAVQDGVAVIGEIEFAYRISKAPIVAITGTNGKSTTTVMTYLCLTACDVPAVLCGNIFGSGYEERSLTAAALASEPDQVLVAEISSYQLEWIRDFRPIAAGITNIWPDHLDRYESFEEYAAAKHRVFENMSGEDVAVVRANDPVVVPPSGSRSSYVPRGRRRTTRHAEPKQSPAVWTFGATGEHGRVEEREIWVMGRSIPLESLPFNEPHNYQNACMASLLAYAALKRRDSALRAVPDCLVDGLKSFHGLEHRMELVGDRGGVRVINNSMCTNPDAVLKSVAAVRDRTHLLMGGVNKNLNFGPLRHYLANQRHRVYLFGSDAAELNEMLGGVYSVYPSMDAAFHAATTEALQGEAIMLAPGCASTDSFRDFRDRGNVFKAIAKEWLRT